MSTIKILLVAVIAALSSNVVYAYDFEVDGIYYNILSEENKTCGVTANPATSYEVSGYKGAINIPEHVAYDNEVYTVTYIYKDAFRRCNKATSISLPNTIDSIATYAFYGTGISDMTIPKSVKKIGYQCLGSCNNLQMVYYNAISCETSSLFDDGPKAVTIGTDVITLPTYLFSGCDSLRTVAFSEPSSLKSVSERAFSKCDNLKYVELPNTLERIDDYAFYDCNGLTTVNLGNSITAIGNHSFQNCYGLTSVIFPNSVEFIGREAFEHCMALTSLVIPSSVAVIETSAFQHCYGLKSLRLNCNINDSTIGSYVFDGCKILTLVIGDNVTSISGLDLSQLGVLENIAVESSNRTYDSRNNCNAIVNTSTNSLIIGCQNTIIPNSVTAIGDKAFSRCNRLTSVTIPNSVTTIGDEAFYSCSGLTSVTIPNSVTTIGDNAFYSCSGLTSVTFNAEKCNQMGSYTSFVFLGCSSLSSLTLGDSVEIIPKYAFIGCSKLTSVTIPNSVTTIGESAFSNCSGLTSVTIPNSVTTIGESAFSDCSGLTSVTIPNSVTSIGESAFYKCTGLTSVTFNAEKCTKMGLSYRSVFSGCTNLTSLTIGEQVTIIPKYAFLACSKLMSVTIPNSVTSIGESAFSNCSGLTSVTIPNSVTSIGNGAFYNCNIENVTIPKSVLSIGSGCFIPSDKDITISVNFNAINCTTESIGPFWAGGQSYLGEIKFGDKVKSIPQHLCYSAEKLTEIKLPASLESIGAGAFGGCIGLTTVKFPKSLISIGGSAFYRCTGLQSELRIPRNIESVGNSAFFGCTGITTVTIESSETLLEAYAFSECTSIKSVNVFSTLPPIGTDDTFALITYRDATLNVPKTAKDAYTRQTCWRNFRHVEEKDFGGVDDVTADEGGICVNVRDGQVEVSGTDASEEVLVYDMSGIEIYRGTERTIALPTKGVYIVKVAGRTFKVAL